MALETNAFSSYDAVGNREDLSDVISNISPTDTPFTTAIGDAPKPKATRVDWQVDTLAAAAENAQLEGDATTTAATTATTRPYNYCQILKKTFRVTGTQEVTVSAGRESEEAYQKTKKLKELKLDREYAFLRGVYATGTEAGSTTVARKLKGALNWLTTNLSKDADATLNADGTVTGGNTRALSLALMKTLMQDIYTSGGNPTQIHAAPYQKGAISDLTTDGRYRTDIEKGKLPDVVDVYMSDFGTLQIVPNRLMLTDVLFFCEPSKWKKAALRPVFSEMLGKTGDSEGYQILEECTLKAHAEAANGRITNLVTA
jgi:hypothetical protein